MKILVTGAAGFIGMHVSQLLLARGDTVVGLDNLNDYYSVQLKRDRLARLTPRAGFSFVHLDVAERDLLLWLVDDDTLQVTLDETTTDAEVDLLADVEQALAH